MSEWLNINSIKSVFNMIIKEFNIPDAWDFDKILEWFEDDKINKSVYFGLGIMLFLWFYRLKFAHPSYLDAFRTSLSTQGVITRVGIILGRVSEYLTNNNLFLPYVAQTIILNYKNIPNKSQQLLSKLLSHDEVKNVLSNLDYKYIQPLPDDVKELIVKKNSKIEYLIKDILQLC